MTTKKELQNRVDTLQRQVKQLETNPLLLGTEALAKIAIDTGMPGIRVPNRGAGAGFGDPITDYDRGWAVEREPVAKRVTVGIADDVVDKWFTVDDPKTEGADKDLDAKVQKQLRLIGAKSALGEAIALERTYGYSVIVGSFNDAKTTEELASERKQGSRLDEVAVYAKTSVTSIEKDRDPDSLRYGEPLIYNINRGDGGRRLRVHYTRVIHVATTSKQISALDNIWDDTTNLRNIRWGMGQTMYRYGHGFPVITLNGKTLEQIQAYAEAGYFSNLTSRTSLLKNETMDIEFKGMQGSALNPEPYYGPHLENISVSTGIPKAILRGNQAGALSGSEVDERGYYKVVSGVQSRLENIVRELVTWVIPQALGKGADTLVGKIWNAITGDEPKIPDFEINWMSGFQPSEKDIAATELMQQQTRELETQYKTVDEIRAEEGLEPLPGGAGNVVIGILRVQNQGQPVQGPGAAPGNPHSGDPPKALTDQKLGSHPQLVSALLMLAERLNGSRADGSIVPQSERITKMNALLEGKRLIDVFIDGEISRAKAYVGAKAGRVVQTLPPEMQRQLDNLRAEYIRDYEAIIEDASPE